MWRRSDEPTTAGIQGPVTDLLLTIYRRRPADSGRIEVTGDAGLVDFWLDRVGFGTGLEPASVRRGRHIRSCLGQRQLLAEVGRVHLGGVLDTALLQ